MLPLSDLPPPPEGSNPEGMAFWPDRQREKAPDKSRKRENFNVVILIFRLINQFIFSFSYI